MRLWIWADENEKEGDRGGYVSTGKPRKKTCACCKGYQIGASGAATSFCKTGRRIFEQAMGVKFPAAGAPPVQIELTASAKSKIVRKMKKEEA